MYHVLKSRVCYLPTLIELFLFYMKARLGTGPITLPRRTMSSLTQLWRSGLLEKNYIHFLKYPVVTSLADRNAKYYHQNKTWIHLKKSHSWCSMFIKCIHILYPIRNYQSMYHCISHCLGTLRKLKLSSHIQRKHNFVVINKLDIIIVLSEDQTTQSKW